MFSGSIQVALCVYLAHLYWTYSSHNVDNITSISHDFTRFADIVVVVEKYTNIEGVTRVTLNGAANTSGRHFEILQNKWGQGQGCSM